MGRAVKWFLGILVLILIVLVSGPVAPGISDIALPLVGLLFLVGGIGSGILSGFIRKQVINALVEGILGIAPGILLTLMAVSVKHIVVMGNILDTILHQTVNLFMNTTPFTAKASYCTGVLFW
jgi:uncharacterized ion transporter superfamily protein YfcC